MLPNLQALDLRSGYITLLVGIETLLHLVYLDIGNTTVETLEQLRGSPSLRYLNIDRCHQLTSVSVLASCSSLEILCIDEESKVRLTDWASLVECKTFTLIKWENWFDEMTAKQVLTRSLFPKTCL
jgi:Leucine-rich repeat (LRR) protein